MNGFEQFLLGSFLLLLTAVAICILHHGYVNTMDYAGYLLRVHARKTRERHERRQKQVSEMWVREIER